MPLPLCAIRGGGDLATGVIARLHRVGFPVVVLELPQPRMVRRRVAFAEAIYTGAITIADIQARRAHNAREVTTCLNEGIIPVAADPDGDLLAELPARVVVDMRMLKRTLPPLAAGAPLTIGAGPGFTAGHNCHAVVETHRGHHLGRVYWQGSAQADTGIPEPVRGYTADRVLRAPQTGTLSAQAEIGDRLQPGDLIASVDGTPITAPFAGVLRGLMHDGLIVEEGEKIGDLDPRNRPDHVTTISDKALAIGGGVLEAVFVGLRTILRQEITTNA